MEPKDGWRTILRAFENQRNYSRGVSPLHEALMDEAARGVMPLAADEAPWPEYAPFAEAVGEAWANRSFTALVEPSLLYAATMHRAVLRGDPEATHLRPFYASVGGRFDPAARDALRAAFCRFWAGAGRETRRFLAEGKLQTNEVSRAPAWMLPAAALRGWFGAQVHLLDLGTSAGLNLASDKLTWEWTTPEGKLRLGAAPAVMEQQVRVEGDAARLGFPLSGSFPLPPVASRVGVDLRPVNLHDPAARLGLRACVWGDQADRLRRLDAAMNAFLALQGPDAPRIERSDMVEGIRKAEVPPPVGTCTVLLVFNTVATIYLEPPQYAALTEAVAERFRALPAGSVGVWVELEGPRPGEPEFSADMRTLRLTAAFLTPEGKLERVLLGRAEPHPRTWTLDATAWARLREGLAPRLC